MALALKDLDREQREAVFSEAAYILVAAPPGSGKTRVLAARFARLLDDGVSAESICALTFTNKSAMEMAERVSAFTDRDICNAFIGTFHALCLEILKKERGELKILGRAEQIEALRDLGVKTPRKTAERISRIKNIGNDINSDDVLRGIFEAYESYLRERRALDLDDLIPEAALLIEEFGINKAFGSPLLHIMVDEYQDINPQQARLLKALAGQRGHVFAIGDADQAIYSFRGASLGFFLSFKERWPGAAVMNLSTNYRSASAVVSASQALIRHNKKRFSLTPKSTRSGGAVSFAACPDEAALSRYIIREIESQMGGLTSLTTGPGGGTMRFSDFAVLFRSRSSAKRLIEAFERGNLPYHLAASASDTQGMEEFLRHLRGLKPGEGVGLVDFIKKESKAAGLQGSRADVILWLASRYGEREAAPLIAGFIEEARALGEMEPPQIKADKVNLMTLHGAKGLEFKTVFIIGVEDGLIPLKREDSVLEEERRLFYVGLTRAADEVVLLGAAKRRHYGAAEDREPSPFIEELGDILTKKTLPAPKKYRRRAVQKGLFE